MTKSEVPSDQGKLHEELTHTSETKAHEERVKQWYIEWEEKEAERRAADAAKPAQAVELEGAAVTEAEATIVASET